MLLEEWTVERFLFEGMIEGFVFFLLLSLLWSPIGGAVRWIKATWK